MKSEEFLTTYEYMQGKISGSFGFQYSKPRAAKEKIEAFLKENPNIEGHIFDFITFICVLRTSKHNRYTIIPLNQFTSKNAIKLYKEKTPQMDYWIRKFQLQYNLRDPFNRPIVGLSEQYMEQQRRKYFNTARGFLHCCSYEGFLYEEKSVSCLECHYNYICNEKRAL